MVLIVLSGLPGTGRSAVAEAVAEERNGVHLSVDAIEDALLGAGLPRTWETGVAAYEATSAAAEQNLALGRLVVVDAVNDSEAGLETWRAAAARRQALPVFVLLWMDDEREHRRRLEERVRNLRHVREPSWAEVRERARTWERWDDCERVDASEPLTEVVQAVTGLLPVR